MSQFLDLTSSWVRPYLPEITFSFVATVLVLYGAEITRFIRDLTRSHHLFVRVLIFMLVSGFGYGLATSKLGDLLEYLLRSKTGSWLGVIVFLTFVGLGFLADRKKQV